MVLLDWLFSSFGMICKVWFMVFLIYCCFCLGGLFSMYLFILLALFGWLMLMCKWEKFFWLLSLLMMFCRLLCFLWLSFCFNLVMLGGIFSLLCVIRIFCGGILKKWVIGVMVWLLRFINVVGMSNWIWWLLIVVCLVRVGYFDLLFRLILYWCVSFCMN